MQGLTVQRDLCLALPQTYNGGGISVTGAKTISAPARPVSRLAAPSHRLRKAQLGAAFGQCVQGQFTLFGMNCGVKERTSCYSL